MAGGLVGSIHTDFGLKDCQQLYFVERGELLMVIDIKITSVEAEAVLKVLSQNVDTEPVRWFANRLNTKLKQLHDKDYSCKVCGSKHHDPEICGLD